MQIRDGGLTARIVVTGSVNDDLMFGSAFNDVLRGGNGNDRLFGNEGDDRLEGGAGDDFLNGGAGNDVFAFDSPVGGGNNVDTILDFDAALDSIRIDSAFYFPGLTVGTLLASQFEIDTATGSGPEIVYNHRTGALFYDSNGAAAGGDLQFAVLNGHPTLTAGNFTIV